MKNLFNIFLTTFCLSFLMACTYNISMAHTSGLAEDVIDDTASNTPNIAPDITIPLIPCS